MNKLQLLKFRTLSLLGVFSLSINAFAQTEFNHAWSYYVSWGVWPLIEKSGIKDEVEKKYNIKVNFKRMDYVPSLNAYAAGNLDSVSMTELDAFSAGAAAGVPTVLALLNSESVGNDALISKDTGSIKKLKGQTIYLEFFTVSHAWLIYVLEKNGMTERDVRLVNMSESSIEPSFLERNDVRHVVTWNPHVVNLLNHPDAKKVVSTEDTPGFVYDFCGFTKKVVEAHPEYAKAMAEMWYRGMELMSARGSKGRQAKADVAAFIETPTTSYNAQLKTTKMFYEPGSAKSELEGPALKKTMQFIDRFFAEHDYPEDYESGQVKVTFPDGSTIGKGPYELIFTTEFSKASF